MSEEHKEVGDSILQFLVRAANKENFNVELTLNVGGAIVTGTMVSAKDYFSSLSERFEGGNEVADILSEQFAKAGEAVDTSEDSKGQFIHMKEAQVYCGDSNPTPSKGEVLWRGKLSAVDGFYLGAASGGENETSKSDEGKDSESDENSADERLDHLEESIGELVDENEEKVKEDEEVSEEKAEDEEASEQKNKRKSRSEKAKAKTTSSSKTKAKKASEKKD
ncbi:gas vesicle accessory protein GvpU [Alkalihalophilus lindianensis]|uniref:Gas vesicle accessory protein GvpU n=1 Tax=Alkalihalophilus lindianensis TaxID=1630542 RepID=A0ABU3X9U1_9BACI|nr:gas vesicle accessory protein GvpU [Alkalihalophilus lindianensis]MDV2684656.1 gas vesicle accessory protein GvpU [Alkalihalophilus lindianensis]